MIRTLARGMLCALPLVLAPMAGLAAAQSRPGPAAEFTVGWLAFPDDGTVNEPMVGGAARFYLRPRVGIGPEVVYIDGKHHSHLMVTGNVTWDILSPINGRSRRITPYLVGGGGIFQTRETFPTGPFTSADPAFTAGGGVRAAAGERFTLGVDARIGWELHLRVNGLVGVRLGP